MAGKATLGAYIKAVLFDESRTGVQRSKTAKRDDQAVGHALGQLGKSRLWQNLNQLAKAVNMGGFLSRLRLKQSLRTLVALSPTCAMR
jgi:hypothetical protein